MCETVFSSANAIRVLLTAMVITAAVPVTQAQEFCSTVAGGDGSNCRDKLLCGVECTDNLCAGMRAYCAAPPKALVERGGRKIKDAPFSSSRLTEIDDGVSTGIAVLPSAVRLRYRKLLTGATRGSCEEISHDGGDERPVFCPNDKWVAGWKCTSVFCERFTLYCCSFTAPAGDGDDDEGQGTAGASQGSADSTSN